MDGYQESLKVEELTEDLLEKNPIRKDSFLEWMKFARTIRTTMDIIMVECQHKLQEARYDKFTD